ncbi:MAG: AMP-binding protein, partial [Rhodospirillales bacterium]|nr:AMP-binding protein [Rhodospirillales bacterium]
MTDQLYPVPDAVAQDALCTNDQYLAMYKRSVEDSEGFWAEQAQRISWFKQPTQIRDVNFNEPDVHIKWFHDGTLNASYNCLDRHLEARGDQVALLWEGDDPSVSKSITYRQLHTEVCKFANVLKSLGVKKGD